MNRRGRRNLGALHKSALILLCAAWEAYVEDLLSESLEFVISKVSTPTELPQNLQKKLCAHVKKEKHELKALELCGDGWKKLCREIIEINVKNFNTLRLINIQDNLYKEFFDGKDPLNLEKTRQKINGKEILTPKEKYFEEVEKMVDERCEHAHARSQGYTTLKALKRYRVSLKKAVQHMEKNVCLTVVRVISQKPWEYN